jgi:hypothetical protein
MATALAVAGGGFPSGGQRGGDNHLDGRKVLEQIAGETGGRMFEASGKQTFSTIYAQIAEELRSQYRLGYTPTPPWQPKGFTASSLLCRRTKLIAQTRDGYYTGN